jgi:tetratricopeptide (TPR) repeat protein
VTRLPAFAAAVLAGALAASPEAQSPTTYREIVDSYSRREFTAAVEAVRALAPAALPEQVKRFLAEGRNAPVLRAALMVHTEALLPPRTGPPRMPGQDYLAHVNARNTLKTAVEKAAKSADDRAFLEAWYLLVIADAQGSLRLPWAKTLAESARRELGEYPDLLLAIGALNELAWTAGREEDMRLGLSGDLKEAESAYRGALKANPSLVEASVRLGRVLTLKGDLDGAVRTLSAIGPQTAEGGFLYLARLFEGAALEGKGDLARAAESYRAAMNVMPVSQSARLALAHLQHAGGHRSEALDMIRESASGTRRADDRTDPWLWYIRGTGWRVPGYLEWLQNTIKP